MDRAIAAALAAVHQGIGLLPRYKFWARTVPDDIAALQSAWERRQAVRHAHEKGAPLKTLASKLGISQSRASQLYCKALKDGVSPVQQWLTREGSTQELCREISKRDHRRVYASRALWAEMGWR